ncbi:hypothetical protein D7D25_17745 [Proteiniphilum sp. X52]|nr:hypothetical protein D7D25_17745 [Proteiniphilum sp. X52]
MDILRFQHFITRAFFKGQGVAVGRNLVVNRYDDDALLLDNEFIPVITEKVNQNLEAHETGHYVQQMQLGFANFYGKILTEYLRYGFNDSYCTPGSLEWNAEEYAIRQVGSLYLP